MTLQTVCDILPDMECFLKVNRFLKDNDGFLREVEAVLQLLFAKHFEREDTYAGDTENPEK